MSPISHLAYRENKAYLPFTVNKIQDFHQKLRADEVTKMSNTTGNYFPGYRAEPRAWGPSGNWCHNRMQSLSQEALVAHRG